MLITPDMAARWLEGNTVNRKLDERRVKQYARDMRNGNWLVTHEGIAFDPNKVLLDGQHRLWAILESKTAITMLVFFNANPKGMLVTNVGKPRSASDVVNLNGRAGTVCEGYFTILKSMIQGRRNSPRMTMHEMEHYFLAYKDAICFSVDHIKTRAKGVSTALTRSVVARAYYSVGHKDLSKFCEKLSTGMFSEPLDYTIKTLRDYLMTTRDYRAMRYGKTERAIEAWWRGEGLRLLKTPTEEIFRLPKPSEITTNAASA